ncbi:hydrolase, alpha/beta fold family [Phenylobacterium zucineum HLK1]|uniref:Hydrolase, alpha/beta fold family n=1 Tax=Phenylobacterium zucineum (strain HLK1) TaxID=450851 RepID=B4R915_PHEZH|nr:alpha/beta hydrolase [Phenylobacterium zucineum]ACG77685.1 hydrolase, alpha/beta fold family [Phenylobacterium zucineum HLK1]
MTPILADAAPPPETPAHIRSSKAAMTQFTHQRLALPTGVELDVLQSGDPLGPPILLLHGLSDSAPSMRPLMEALPPHVRAIAITQRGHGDSGKPAGPYATDAFVADAAAALDALGVRRTVVYGHSMGSLVAQRFAMRHPERTAGLVLEGAFPSLSGNAAVQAWYEAEIAPMTAPMSPEAARAFQESTLARPVPPAFLDLVTNETQKLPVHAWKAILQGMMAEDCSAELRRLQVPALIIWGDQDAFVGRGDQDVLKTIPGSRLVVFEGAGHSPHWEDPEQVAGLIAMMMQAQRAVEAAR